MIQALLTPRPLKTSKNKVMISSEQHIHHKHQLRLMLLRLVLFMYPSSACDMWHIQCIVAQRGKKRTVLSLSTVLSYTKQACLWVSVCRWLFWHKVHRHTHTKQKQNCVCALCVCLCGYIMSFSVLMHCTANEMKNTAHNVLHQTSYGHVFECLLLLCMTAVFCVFC